jgi:F1F0 ATPase subunit 2
MDGMIEAVRTALSEPIAGAVFGLAAGALLGLAHFGSLWWNTGLYARGGAAAALVIQLARFAVLGLVLAGLAHLGAMPLLAGALGLIAVRHLVVRRLGRIT